MTDLLDINQIEEHLYLGSALAANDVENLLKNGIKYVLSVFDDVVHNKCDLITYKTIPVADMYDEDLLSHFPEAIDYISEAQTSGQSVLVHCHLGASRSATVVMAYLMHKYKMPFNTVKELVKSKRCIGPNRGFINQLTLYEEMGATLNANNRNLRKYLVEAVLKSDLHVTKWTNKLNVFFNKLDEIEKFTENVNFGSTYLCSICNFKLFNEIHIIQRLTTAMDPERFKCSYVYVEPQKWMKELFDVKESDSTVPVKCPQCSQDLVEYIQQFSHILCNCDAHKRGIIGMRFRVSNKKIKMANK